MIRQYDAAIVLMHMRGTRGTVQRNVRYKMLRSGNYRFFEEIHGKLLGNRHQIG